MIRLHFLDLNIVSSNPFLDTLYIVDDGIPPRNASSETWTGIQSGDVIAVEELYSNGDVEGLRVLLPVQHDDGDDDDGSTSCPSDQKRFRLVPIGIEVIEWPADVIAWANTHPTGSSLRELYHEVLDRAYEAYADGIDFTDWILMGHDTVEEYWNNPLLQQEEEEEENNNDDDDNNNANNNNNNQGDDHNGERPGGGRERVILLSDCTWKPGLFG